MKCSSSFEMSHLPYIVIGVSDIGSRMADTERFTAQLNELISVVYDFTCRVSLLVVLWPSIELYPVTFLPSRTTLYLELF